MSEHNEKFYENETGVYFKSGYPSQWFESKFVIDGVEYNCCEQYMMAQKAKTFEDFETQEKIMLTPVPKEQKVLGRSVKNFDEDKWNAIADEIVYQANLAKFTQNLVLQKALLETDNKIIVECSPYDKIWGNGLNITDTLNTAIENWKGTNRLGKAIMRVRETLQKC
jgi:ribA/ribD-fused uncharacterized protein